MVVYTVGFVYWIANFLLVLAVKVVIETFNVVAGLITLAVVEDTPAVCTTSPGVHCERAVATVPAAKECVAFLVANPIVGFAMAVCKRARGCWNLDGSAGLLAPFTCPVTGTLAVEVREAGLFGAQPSIPAGLGGAAFIAAMLTLGPTITRQAGATCPPHGKCTAPSIVAGQLPTGHASFTIWPSVTKLTRAAVSQRRAAGDRTDSSALTRLGLAHTEPALTPPAGEARLADTLVVIGQLDTVKAVGGTAGVRETLVYVSLASFPCESGGTIAAVSTNSVDTGAIVKALGRSTARP